MKMKNYIFNCISILMSLCLLYGIYGSIDIMHTFGWHYWGSILLNNVEYFSPFLLVLFFSWRKETNGVMLTLIIGSVYSYVVNPFTSYFNMIMKTLPNQLIAPDSALGFFSGISALSLATVMVLAVILWVMQFRSKSA